METAVFGGGCFWCTEAVFLMLRGVTSVLPGYAGGTVSHPTYDQVTGGKTGHAEVVQITYDPRELSFEDLLTVFFSVHDPASRFRQGNDVGPQYRSVIFYTTNQQQVEAMAYIAELSKNKKGSPIVTEVLPLDQFWLAEDYHQNYYLHHSDAPYCQLVIDPKLDHLRAEFSQLLKTHSK